MRRRRPLCGCFPGLGSCLPWTRSPTWDCLPCCTTPGRSYWNQTRVDHFKCVFKAYRSTTRKPELLYIILSMQYHIGVSRILSQRCVLHMCEGLYTYRGRTSPFGVMSFSQLRSRNWLGALSAPTHFLNQWWLLVIYNIGNNHQSNIFRNSHIFIEEIALETVVCVFAP